MTRIVRFGAGCLAELPAVCSELGVERPLLVATRRGADAARGLSLAGVFDGVRPHAPVETVAAAAALADDLRADALVGLGGGAAIDTAKAAAAAVLERRPGASLAVVAVPTTYAGAEWTPFFGTLLSPGVKGGGRDARAAPVAALYDPELTLELPLRVSVGTSLNALAHCAEAYYHPSTNASAQRHADAGATAIAHALPLVVARPLALDSRTWLLEGAMHAALALAESGLCLAHALAQALGGRYGLEQGAMNAVCLPAALAFNREAVPDAVARLGAALDGDAVERAIELAALGGFTRLAAEGVPPGELDVVAREACERRGARDNPRPVTPMQAEELLRSVY